MEQCSALLTSTVQTLSAIISLRYMRRRLTTRNCMSGGFESWWGTENASWALLMHILNTHGLRKSCLLG